MPGVLTLRLMRTRSEAEARSNSDGNILAQNRRTKLRTLANLVATMNIETTITHAKHSSVSKVTTAMFMAIFKAFQFLKLAVCKQIRVSWRASNFVPGMA
jgi:hypothetical protein